MKAYISTKGLEVKLDKNSRQINKLCKRGMPYIRLGERTKLFDEDAVIAWLQNREVAA